MVLGTSDIVHRKNMLGGLEAGKPVGWEAWKLKSKKIGMVAIVESRNPNPATRNAQLDLRQNRF
jgi:hypothetical protein